MKSLLLLYVSAALVRVSISISDGYIKFKVNKHYPPLNPQDFIYVIIRFYTGSLDQVFADLNNPHKNISIDDVTIFIDQNWQPPNPYIQTVSKNFSSPEAAMNSINSYIASKTSEKIINLLKNININTTSVIVNTNNALSVPSAGGTGWTKQLRGNYMKVENSVVGVTLIEIRYTPYISVLFAIPYPGKEEEVGLSLNPGTIDVLTKSMTLQYVNIEVPRLTLFTGAYRSLDIIPMAYGKRYITWYGFQVSAKFP